MKFNPTPNQLVLLVILLAAPILAHLFAPPAIGVLSSMVSTVFGALFVNLREPPPPPPPDGEPKLEVIDGGKS